MSQYHGWGGCSEDNERHLPMMRRKIGDLSRKASRREELSDPERREKATYVCVHLILLASQADSQTRRQWVYLHSTWERDSLIESMN